MIVDVQWRFSVLIPLLIPFLRLCRFLLPSVGPPEQQRTVKVDYLVVYPLPWLQPGQVYSRDLLFFNLRHYVGFLQDLFDILLVLQGQGDGEGGHKRAISLFNIHSAIAYL